MLLAVVALAALAIAAPWISRMLGRMAGPALMLVPAAAFIGFIGQMPKVAHGDTLRESWAWIPDLGVSLSFRLDGLALLFACLITGIGSLIVLYASDYLKDHPLRHRFFAYLIGFMTSMLGVVTADNILLLFVFWEFTSLTSYLLIGFDHDKADSRKSALQALLVTGLGGLAMLAGLFLLGIAAGDLQGVRGGIWEISEIVKTEGLGEHPLVPGILFCVLLGAFTKSAQFPFHFWLPNAMAAPTPVSAYLHSSTMVKAGVYLLMRLNPAFDDVVIWSWLLAGFGATTMLLGAVLAVRETYFKKVLAYSTVSSLGIMILFTGVSGEIGAEAAVGYLLAHALFKACLFLVAGSTTHATGLKDIEQLGGLAKALPVTAVCGLIGALSMAGAPPLMGFIGKELLLKATTHPPDDFILWKKTLVLTGAVFVAAALTVLVSVLVGWRPFFAKSASGEPIKSHGLSWRLWIAPAVLAGLTVIGPLAPGLFAQPLIESGMASLGHPADHHIHIGLFDMLFPFAKFSAAFAFSMAALGLGAGLYLIRGRVRPVFAGVLGVFETVSARATYDRALPALHHAARFQTRLVQNGYLRRYIATILVATAGLVIWAVVRTGRGIPVEFTADFRLLDLVLIVLMLVGALAATRYRSRLATVAALGAVGYAVAMTFVMLGVPDIAMTQFSIETLTVVIFVAVIYHLPRFHIYSATSQRAGDITVALVFGACITGLVLITTGNSLELTPISSQLGEWSSVEAFGRNVVNVILVDFRGLDTMGEITVLGLAAIGVYTLLKLRSGGPPPPRLVGGTESRYGAEPGVAMASPDTAAAEEGDA